MPEPVKNDKVNSTFITQRSEMFETYNNIVILTGSGTSAESGIETFRADDGLWARHRIEDIATPDGYRRNPQLVYGFYNQRHNQLSLPRIQPNDAHLAIAELQQRYSGKEIGRAHV